MDDVFFHTGNSERVKARFERNQLRLGRIVHVELDKTGAPRSFKLMPTATTVPHAIEWIAPSDWVVSLVPKWRVDERTVDRVAVLVEPRLDRDEVRRSLAVAASDVRLEHQYKTDEYRRSRLHTIESVLERLDLIDRVTEPESANALFHHWGPLCIYLLLTCFDLLGQPARWLPFGSWLRAHQVEDERAEAAAAASAEEGPVSAAQVMFAFYESRYGVGSGFYRFLREVLPPDARRTLLNSFQLVQLKNPPELGEPVQLSDSAKERYLYETRNSYTHRAQFIPGPDTSRTFPELSGATREAREQLIEANVWTTVFTVGWPTALEDAVKAGLAGYLRAIDSHN